MNAQIEAVRRGTGKNLKALGLSSVDRELLFVTEHPEFRNLTPYLRGVYSTCQAQNLDGGPVELDEAFEHYNGCEWCRRHFEYRAAPLRALLNKGEENIV
jgi:hypothetical protein